MYRVVIFLLVVCTSCRNLNNSSKLSIYEAVNKAGYQRMLTQRIAKCYLSILIGIDTKKHKKDLQESTKKFEQNLVVLKNYAPTEKIKDYYNYIEILWQEYQFVHKQEFTAENAATILKNNNNILEASHTAVLLLEEYAVEKKLYEKEGLFPLDLDLAAVINLSGRQRMLTQRAALYALAKTYAIGNQTTNNQYYHKAVEEFDAAFKKLLISPKNTPTIREEYNGINKSWEQLKAAWEEIMNSTSNKHLLEEKVQVALQKTDALLISLHNIVSLYEQQD